MIVICMNFAVFPSQRVKAYVTGRGKKFVTVLLSEIYPDKLKLFSDIDVYVLAAQLY